MKKFFKDVIGEIRNPSEDAGKVLGIIRRLLITIFLFSFITFFFNIGFSIYSLVYSSANQMLVYAVERQGIFFIYFPL